MTVQPMVFHVLKEPLSDKKLRAFRADAGWKDKVGGPLHKDPRGAVQWVSVEMGKLQIGVVRLELAPPEFCYVADFIIKKEHRGKGIGKWLMRCIEQYCAGRGIRRLLLETTENARTFYEQYGFRPDPMLPTILKRDIPVFLPKMVVPIVH